jgi:hypothetical protein
MGMARAVLLDFLAQSPLCLLEKVAGLIKIGLRLGA